MVARAAVLFLLTSVLTNNVEGQQRRGGKTTVAMVARAAVLFLLTSVLTNNVEGQQRGGRNVCVMTMTTSMVKELDKTECGFWAVINQCSKYRSRTQYQKTFRPQCCRGWLPQKQGSRDCDITVCFGRRGGEDRGTCMNGGKCVGPDRCQCPDGFQLPQCTDVDECTESIHTCSHNCTNTGGSYTCSCPDRYGLLSDGKTCGPTCFGIAPPGTCLNQHECLGPDVCDCGTGYLQPNCEDEDECVSAPCQQTCINTPGTFNCSCQQGFLLQQDGTTCQPQCTHVPIGRCPHGGTCVKPGVCACAPGFSPPDCQDIDECSLENECKQSCKNTEGSFTCGCDTGYKLTTDGSTCNDINECNIRNGGCMDICHNSPGSFSCECSTGLVKQPDGKTCKARCRADWEPGVCPNGGSCQLTRICLCSPGFEGPECDNINECEQNNGACSHECTDTPGSFTCACPQGYVLQNGIYCEDVDECEGGQRCGGVCVNQPGSYTCRCSSGLVLAYDRINCQDEDECRKASHGCSHICHNTYGSYECACGEGNVLSGDGRTCFEKKICTSHPEEGCWAECRVNNNGACTCPQGMTLFVDQKHCINPCTSSPCLHGGQCQPDIKLDYICDCSRTGYSGDKCQYGSIEFPRHFDARKSVTYHNITVRVTSGEDTIIYATSTAQVKIFPNPITIWKSESSFNLSLRAEESGILHVKFKVTNPQIRKKTFSMKVRSADVFSRHHLLFQNLPEGCFYLDLPDVLEQVFRSTKPWFRIKTDKKSYFTFGITYLMMHKTALPLRNDGMQVIFGSSVHISRLPPRRRKSHGIRHNDSRDKHCTELHFTPTELDEFNDARSLLKTLCNALGKLLPYWFTLEIPAPKGVKKQPHYFQTKTLLGKQIKNFELCAIDEVDDSVMYAVILFNDLVDYRMAGQTFSLPRSEDSKPYCLIIDFVKTATFVIVSNTDLSCAFHASLLDLSVTSKMTNVELNPRAWGITKGWDYRQLYDYDFLFYNGDSIQEYQKIKDVTWFGRFKMSAKLDLVQGNTAEIHAHAAVYSDANTQTVFTHLFTKAITYILPIYSIKYRLNVQIMGKMYSFESEVETLNDAAIISSGGNDGERVLCGMTANPPGFFYHTKVIRFVSKKIALLTDFMVDVWGEAYYFITFDEKKDIAVGANLKRLEHVISGLLRRIAKFKQLLSKMKRGRMPRWKNKSVLDMTEMSTRMARSASLFDISNLTIITFADFSQDLIIQTKDLRNKVNEFSSRLHISFDSDVKAAGVLRKAFSLVDGQVKGIWWENFDSSIPFFPKDKVHGLKTVGKFRIFEFWFTLDLELVFSAEGLMKCSDLYEYYDHFAGGDLIVRGRGVLTESWIQSIDSRYGEWVALFAIMMPKLGESFELAMSQTKPVFAVRLEVAVKIFRSRASAGMFITNNKVAAMTELDMFDLFRVRLTLGVALPPKAIWIQGDFLAGPDRSFHLSLQSAVKRMIRSLTQRSGVRHRETLVTLDIAERYLRSAWKKVRHAEQTHKKRRVSMSSAARKFEAAKARLDKAKKLFRKGRNKLTAAQKKIDGLCKMRDCHGQCQVKVDRSQCTDTKRSTTQCLRREPCFTRFAKMSCLIKNAGCRVIRALGSTALAAADIFISVQLVALESAKTVVSLAQIAVDKASYLSAESLNLYNLAGAALNMAKTGLQLARRASELVFKMENFFLEMSEALLLNVLGNFIDIRKCGFRIEVSLKNWFLINCYCEINFMSRGWSNHSFTLNFKDISSSMFSFAKSTVDKAKTEAGRSRLRRSLDAPTGLASEGFNDSKVVDTQTFEYNSWALRCERWNYIISFLNNSLEVLKIVSRELSVEADAAERHIAENKDEDDSFGNLTLDDIGADVKVALADFNLTRQDLELALASASLEDDELVLATKDFKTTIMQHNAEAVQAVRDSSLVSDWISHMDTVTHIDEDCLNFRDCVAWSFGELRLLLDSLDPELSDVFTNALKTAENDFLDLIKNESKTINQTTDPNIDLTVLENLKDIFCASLPVLLETPQNVTVQMGHGAKFSCIATGTSPLTYYWFSRDVLIAYGNNRTTLSLSNISTADEGIYSCSVGNHIGNVSSPAVRLHVVYPPKIITDLPQVFELRADNRAPPKVILGGKPRPKVTWYSCSRRTCRVDKSLGFPGLPDNFNSGELIYKYKGHNPYGDVYSAEMLVVLYDRKPAVPEKVLHIWYTVSPAVDDMVDSADEFHPEDDSSIFKHFQLGLSKRYINPNGCLELVVRTTDLRKQYMVISLQPKLGCLQSGANVDTIMTELKTSVADILKDGRIGGVVYNDSRRIYSYSLADEVREDSVKFHCEQPWVFQPPTSCVRKPPRLQLEPPKDVQATRSEDYIYLRWQPPFYDGYLLKGYSVWLTPESGAAVRHNTSSRDPSFPVPVSACGEVCEVQVSALTASYRSPWTVHKAFSWAIAQYYTSVALSDWLRETHLQNMDAPIEFVVLTQNPNFNLEYEVLPERSSTQLVS